MFGCCLSKPSKTNSNKSNKQQQDLKINRAQQETKDVLPLLTAPITPPPGPRYIAIYDYNAINDGDLTFRKGENLYILDFNGDWWKAQSASSYATGFVPNNYVAPIGGLESQEWFFGDMPRIESERALKRHDLIRGTFLIRKSASSSGGYSLSVLDDTLAQGRVVKHYRVLKDESGGLHVTTKNIFQDLFDMVSFYKSTQEGLCCMLTEACPKIFDISPLPKDKFTIDRSDVAFLSKIGAGKFGEVWKGIWKNTNEVAIKTLKRGTMSPGAFLAEAEVMKDLFHKKLLRLYAVVPDEPIFIVTEFMTHGSLLEYLKEGEGKRTTIVEHVDMAAQIAAGMAYLEQLNYIHRDLRAANILVGDYQVCKIGDFGLARLLTDGIYKSRNGGVAPIKWTAPEALAYDEFSTKSDVWSFGVLLTEIVTRGRTPYPGMMNCEILSQIEKGYRMPIPNLPPPHPPCPEQIYDLMLQCWNANKDYRPCFRDMQAFLEDFFTGKQRYEPPIDGSSW